jgi:hypothetical protein
MKQESELFQTRKSHYQTITEAFHQRHWKLSAQLAFKAYLHNRQQAKHLTDSNCHYLTSKRPHNS